jgi:ATP-dependent 26S proteasome regulatory subunit
MDGLRGEADVFLILTMNRPEMLDAALAARPGRIDQAIEFPRPDDDGREKLVRLYAGTLAVREDLRRLLVSRTAGVSAAFIRELMRRLAQASLCGDTPAALSRSYVDAALEEMLFARGMLNARLLGGAGQAAAVT